MFEYFPGVYWLNMLVHVALASGLHVDDVDKACKDLKDRLAAGGLSPEDKRAIGDQWHDTWQELAERRQEQAAADAASENFLSAAAKYRRAAASLFVAEQLLPFNEQRQQTYGRSLSLFSTGIRSEAVRCVEIPFSGTCLDALYLPVGGEGPKPVVIHFNGFHTTKEFLYLCGIGHLLRERGLASLIVDQPGSGTALRLKGMGIVPNMGPAATACVDWCQSQADIDSQRIGIMAQSLGGYHAPRAAIEERRISACVSWGALYSWHEILKARIPDLTREVFVSEENPIEYIDFDEMFYKFAVADKYELYDITSQITLQGQIEKLNCDFLVVHGKNDLQVPYEQAERVIAEAVNARSRELVAVTATEGGDQHCNVDNPPFAMELMADWLGRKLGRTS